MSLLSDTADHHRGFVTGGIVLLPCQLMRLALFLGGSGAI
jgi:hypothetical protein